MDLSSIVCSNCDEFLITEGNTLVCSKCEKIMATVENEIEISTQYNPQTVHLLHDKVSFTQTAKRLAQDPTCELTEVKCNKCGSRCRYVRDNAQVIYVCSECMEIQ